MCSYFLVKLTIYSMFGSYGIHKLDVLSVWYNLARNLRFLLYFSVEVLLIEIYSPKK